MNDKRYEQFDGVSIDFSLGSVLANIITEQENVLKPLQQYSLTKHYMLYVDDTLLHIKQKKQKLRHRFKETQVYCQKSTIYLTPSQTHSTRIFSQHQNQRYAGGWFLQNYSYTWISIRFITVFLLCHIGHFTVNLHSVVTWI